MLRPLQLFRLPGCLLLLCLDHYSSCYEWYSHYLHRLSDHCLTLDFVRVWDPSKATTPKRFGQASKRSPAQLLAAKDYASQLICKIPSACTIIYTDGSAIPNPGPSGAGAFILQPGLPPVRLSASLGLGTNNFGEAWAIGMAISYLLTSSQASPSRFCVILSDSQVCVNALRKGFCHDPKLNYLFQKIFSMLSDAPFVVKPCWIPGHAGVPGNDEADRLAGLGSENFTKDCPPPEPFFYSLLSPGHP